MVLFLLLGVIWAIVLVPPWLQSRREARPIASIMSFRSQLWSLERATPHYGADAYGSYGDDAYDDTYGSDTYASTPTRRGVGDDTGESPRLHAFEPGRASPRRANSAPSRCPGRRADGRVARRRAMAYRRRLSLPCSCWRRSPRWCRRVAGRSVADRRPGGGDAARAYLGLLIRLGRQHAERSQKVRYLRRSGASPVGRRDHGTALPSPEGDRGRAIARLIAWSPDRTPARPGCVGHSAAMLRSGHLPARRAVGAATVRYAYGRLYLGPPGRGLTSRPDRSG